MSSLALLRHERRMSPATSGWWAHLGTLTVGAAVLATLALKSLTAVRATAIGTALASPAGLRAWALAQTVVALLVAPLLTLELFAADRHRSSLIDLFLSRWPTWILVLGRVAWPVVLALGGAVALGLPGWLLASLLGRTAVSAWLTVQLQLCAMALFASLLGLLASAICGRVSAAAACAYLLIALMALAPLWIGPLVERQANARAVIDAALLASPLVGVSSGLDFDLLRTETLYRLSPLGQRRLLYPAWWQATLLYLSLSLLCFGGAVWAVAARRRGARM